MVQLRIGRHGVLLLVALFLFMGIEDIIIWINTGTVPALEFFGGMILVLVVAALAVHEARSHRPPHH